MVKVYLLSRHLHHIYKLFFKDIWGYAVITTL